MLILGQLLDLLDSNEVITIKGRHGVHYIEELKLTDALQLLTKEARTCPIDELYTDTVQHERTIEGSQLVIYIKPNGYFILNGEVEK